MNIKQIDVGGISVDVVFKNIKNVHLSVHPPTGKVRISAPSYMKIDTIRVFAISKMDWIKKQQENFKGRRGRRHANIWIAKVTMFGVGVICSK